MYSYQLKNFEDLLYKTVEFSKNNRVKKILIFSKSLDSVLNLKKMISNEDIELICVTFPMNQEYLIRNEDGEIEKMQIELHSLENRDILNQNNIKLTSSMMPFDDIITQSTGSNKHSLIEESLTIVHPALPLAVQSVLIATDTGYVSPGEEIVSIVKGVSILVNGTNSRYLFHPQEGMKIKEIIAKIKED